MEIKELFTIRNVFFIALLIFVVYFIIQIKEIALLFFGAYVIACSLTPLVDKLEKKKMNRGLAAGLVVILTSVVGAIFLLPIFIVSIREASAFFENMPDKIEWLKHFLSHTQINGATLLSMINLEEMAHSSSAIAKNVLSSSINFTKSVGEGVAIGFSIIMIVFYLLLDKKLLHKALLRFFPSETREKVKEIHHSIEEKVGGYVIAQSLSMVVVGVITALGLLIFKIKYAIVLGLIAGILDIIPIIGPIVAFSLGAFVALQKGWLYIIPVAVIYVGAQWISNQIVRPLVFGKFMDMHPLLIIFAFLVAAKFLGVWGVILAPAIASLFTVLIDELYLKTVNQGSVETSNE